MSTPGVDDRVVVLVPGACHGAWGWHRMLRHLINDQRMYFPLTLTGLGDRRHQIHPGVDLEYHARDVVRAIVANGLERVILVAHSQAGLVTSRAASLIPDRIDSLVYLDAVITPNGEAPIDVLPVELVRMLENNATKTGAGWLVTPTPELVEGWGITHSRDLEWVTPLLAPHPLAAFKQAVDLSALRGSGISGTYVRFLRSNVPALGFAETASGLGYEVIDLDVVHDAPIVAPTEVATCLSKILGTVQEG